MNSKSDALDSIENREENGLLPDKVAEEVKKLLDSNENIDQEVASYALDRASEYWRQHIEDRGQVVKGPKGIGIKLPDNFNDSFRETYGKDITRDLHREWKDQLEMEDVSELAQKLTKMPENDKYANVPWDYDPKFTPENYDYPSMFQ